VFGTARWRHILTGRDQQQYGEDAIAVYRETVRAFYGFVARRAGGSRELAEDVTQETYMRFLAQCQGGKAPSPALPWLCTVARNLLLNHHRRVRPASVDPAMLDRVMAGRADGVEGAAAAIQWGLSRLRPGPARLLESFHLDGRSVAEIAGETGMSERAVEGRLRRARAMLRKALEPLVREQGSNHAD
jgi:RNA polymerase sigma-70 factor (ECF subfamily)